MLWLFVMLLHAFPSLGAGLGRTGPRTLPAFSLSGKRR